MPSSSTAVAMSEDPDEPFDDGKCRDEHGAEPQVALSKRRPDAVQERLRGVLVAGEAGPRIPFDRRDGNRSGEVHQSAGRDDVRR